MSADDFEQFEPELLKEHPRMLAFVTETQRWPRIAVVRLLKMLEVELSRREEHLNRKIVKRIQRTAERLGYDGEKDLEDWIADKLGLPRIDGEKGGGQ